MAARKVQGPVPSLQGGIVSVAIGWGDAPFSRLRERGLLESLRWFSLQRFCGGRGREMGGRPIVPDAL